MSTSSWERVDRSSKYINRLVFSSVAVLHSPWRSLSDSAPLLGQRLAGWLRSAQESGEGSFSEEQGRDRPTEDCRANRASRVRGQGGGGAIQTEEV